MSRIGTQPVSLPQGVTLTVADGMMQIKGPKGEQTVVLPSSLTVSQEDSVVTIKRTSEEQAVRAIHGTVRALVANAVTGVSEGWTKELEFIGSGYRAAVNGRTVELLMGYSHPVHLEIPAGLETTVVKNVITVTGIDRQAVGQFAAIIRAVRKPEPYKGKGIRYVGEHVRRKTGKALKSGA